MKHEKETVELLPRSGSQYKLNLHTHSTLSDGNFSPEQLKEMYMAQGYSGVAFTDHRKCIPHCDLTDERFVALTGTEIDFGSFDANGNFLKAVHLNALARDPMTVRTYSSMPLDFDLINKTVQELKQDHFFVTLNHPVWSNMSTDEVLRIQGADAIEVYNSIAVAFNNYSDDSAFYEYFLRADRKALPIAADDCHKIFEDGSPFAEYYRGFTVVKAPELSYDSIINALDTGSFYSSTGPRFENLWLEGNLLHVECSPVYAVFVHSKYLACKTADVRKTDCITETVLDISEIRARSPYFWVQLRDTHGEKAWAVPYWFE